MVVIWLLIVVVYYGINLNVVNLGMNFYVGVFLNVVIEWFVFVIIVVLLEWFGWRFMLVFVMMLSGFCCFVGSFLFIERSGSVYMSLLDGLILILMVI